MKLNLTKSELGSGRFCGLPGGLHSGIHVPPPGMDSPGSRLHLHLRRLKTFRSFQAGKGPDRISAAHAGAAMASGRRAFARPALSRPRDKPVRFPEDGTGSPLAQVPAGASGNTEEASAWGVNLKSEMPWGRGGQAL